MHRFFVPHVEQGSAILPPDEARHLVRVLRLGVGSEVFAFDGRGAEWRARVAEASAREVRLDLIEPRDPVREPEVKITLAIGLLKGDEIDAVVRDATALGVAAIRPFAATRAVVPPAARQARAVERWTKLAVAAAKQCGRAVVPAIHEAAPFEDVLEAGGSAVVRIACVEPSADEPEQDRTAITIARPVPGQAVTLFVGPEGGWAETELAGLQRTHAVRLRLGPRTLRAGLAPVVALSVLWSAWDWDSPLRAVQAVDGRVQR